jgi:Domain of unknown function (DUF4277)
MAGMRVERLDHLGIVAGVCQEIGLAAYLDALAGPSQQQVSVGTATVAMILNGLGFSNHRHRAAPRAGHPVTGADLCETLRTQRVSLRNVGYGFLCAGA